MGIVMSHKERVINTIERREVDYPPTQIDLTPSALDAIASHWQVHRSEEAMMRHLDNHIVYAYLNDPMGDMRRRNVSQSQKVLYDEWGVGWDTQQEGIHIVVHPLADINKYPRYQFPDPNSPSLMDVAFRTVEVYIKEYFVVAFQATCLFERAWALRGFENFLLDMVLNRDFAETLLDKITDYQVEIAKRFCAIGVDCARTSDDYGGQENLLMSPKMWREMIKPRLKRIWEVYLDAGVMVMHHSCGDVQMILEDLVDMGMTILHPVQPKAMPVDVLKAKFGGRITFYGGICTQQTLPFGTPQDVFFEVEERYRVLGNGGGYIIAPSVAITSDVSKANIEALIKALQKFR
ncbi:MAG: uroporphyrinogen decarboxylase family protein [Bacillota bacterium]